MGISVSDLKIVCVAGVVVVVVIGIVTSVANNSVTIDIQISYSQVDDAPIGLGDIVYAVCIVIIVVRVQWRCQDSAWGLKVATTSPKPEGLR